MKSVLEVIIKCCDLNKLTITSMKFSFTLALILAFSTSFCQWTKSSSSLRQDIFHSFIIRGTNLYAGGKNVVYISRGQRTNLGFNQVLFRNLRSWNNIIIYKNELVCSVLLERYF